MNHVIPGHNAEVASHGLQSSRGTGLSEASYKMKIMASGIITSWQIDGEIMKTVVDFVLGGAPKLLQMVTATMKLKDACSLEEKL